MEYKPKYKLEVEEGFYENDNLSCEYDIFYYIKTEKDFRKYEKICDECEDYFNDIYELD